MNQQTQYGSRRRIQRYLVDFLASSYPRHAITGTLGIMAALLIWSVLSSHQNLAATIQGVPLSEPQPGSEIMAQHVAMEHLFGQDTAAQTAPAQAQTQVQVGGIIYSDDKDSALAILVIDGESKMLRIGDTLPDGEQLLGIAPYAVELGGHGTQRIIALPRDTDAGGLGLRSVDNPFPDIQATGNTMPSVKTVELSPGASPLSQLQSLRQQLIHPKPAASMAQPAKRPIKP